MEYGLREYTKSFVKTGRKPMNSSRPVWIYIECIKEGVFYGAYFANWK